MELTQDVNHEEFKALSLLMGWKEEKIIYYGSVDTVYTIPFIVGGMYIYDSPISNTLFFSYFSSPASTPLVVRRFTHSLTKDKLESILDTHSYYRSIVK